MSETSITTPSGSEKGRYNVKKVQNSSMFDDSPIAGETGDEFQEDIERTKARAGEEKFHRLGWKRLTIVLIVEAIALGSLSLPSAFAALGMVAGVICSVGLGLLAIYTSDLVGMVKMKFPEVAHYADAGRLVAGRFGYELVGGMFVLQLVLLVGSHCLTGTIAFLNITNNGACSLVFGVVSAIILFLLAIPPSFAELAILGYIDFVSIILAIGITMIATGIKASHSAGGMSSVPWSAWPKDDLSFADAFIAITNIVFAYSFSICQFSFMDEMHTPKDYKKSIWALGLIEIAIYTITGAVIYAFVGPDVKSPALLSAGDLISKVAFGIGLPVIFISGSINSTVVGRFIHGRIFKNSVVKYINTPTGWATWIGLIAAITVIAWVIAEAIPFFSDLLSISSSLFISGFTYYFPAIFWFVLLREGSLFERKNLIHLVLSSISMIVGLIVLVGGTYASIVDIRNQYKHGSVRGVFTCAPLE
ncbi:amino acid transporter [Trichoderma cornu-damae]|uniref:Amino acid transporter n=1 Tax=Trichoderma cornu-damae TaxID=654480 RepID=A0A9P8U0E7_9HYPO|nr:amino acid transporter [Trichoderma cornu-damae]